MNLTPQQSASAPGQVTEGNAGARQAFYSAISAHSMTPLWEVLHALVPPLPATPCQPALWTYADVRPYLMRSGQLITAEERQQLLQQSAVQP